MELICPEIVRLIGERDKRRSKGFSGFAWRQ